MATIGTGTLVQWKQSSDTATVANAAMTLYNDGIVSKDLSWLPVETQQMIAMYAAKAYKDKLLAASKDLTKKFMDANVSKQDDEKSYNSSTAAGLVKGIIDSENYQKLSEICDWFKESSNPGSFIQIQDALQSFLEGAYNLYSGQTKDENNKNENTIKAEMNEAWLTVVGKWFESAIVDLGEQVRKSSQLRLTKSMEVDGVRLEPGESYFPQKSLVSTIRSTQQYKNWQEAAEHTYSKFEVGRPSNSVDEAPEEERKPDNKTQTADQPAEKSKTE